MDSINRESVLSESGRVAVPEMLIAALVNRLEIEHWYDKHPEIDEQQIVAPLFGIGLPRTGTTTRFSTASEACRPSPERDRPEVGTQCSPLVT